MLSRNLPSAGSAGSTSRLNPRGSYRTWCYTLNNYTESEEQSLRSLDDELFTYHTFGKETGQDQNTPHLQGVVSLSRTHRLASVKRIIGDRAHVSPCHSGLQAAARYCHKEDKDPFIKDNRKQGNRTDLEETLATLETRGLLAAAMDHPSVFVKFHSGLTKYAILITKKRDRNTKPFVMWLYGATGTGKSKLAYERYGDDIYTTMGTYKWWDGYRQQRAVLLDDFRNAFAPFHIMLKILDRYPMQIEIKGGTTQLDSPIIVITSSNPPHLIYNPENRSGEDIHQLHRRIDLIVRFASDGAKYKMDSHQLAHQENSASAPGFQLLGEPAVGPAYSGDLLTDEEFHNLLPAADSQEDDGETTSQEVLESQSL